MQRHDDDNAYISHVHHLPAVNVEYMHCTVEELVEWMKNGKAIFYVECNFAVAFPSRCGGR